MEIVKFNKQDFLTPYQLALKLGENKDNIKKSMRTLFVRGVRITANNHKTPLITRNGNTYRIHPLGLDVFMEYFNNQKVKA